MKKKSTLLVDKDQVLRDMLAESRFGTFFGVSQDVFDAVWNQLTGKDGNSVTYVSMEIGADLDVFHPVKKRLQALEIDDSQNPELKKFIGKFLHGPTKIPNYSGGLGILAGDTLKSFADCHLPAIGISLLYQKGYFSQLVDSKLGQVSWALEWEPEEVPGLYLLKDPQDPSRPFEIEVLFHDNNDREIRTTARLWMKMEISAGLDFFVPEILLDYNTPSTPDWIQKASLQLYDSSTEQVKILQRRLLGAGVRPAMKALGITSDTIHLNEQHGVVLVFDLIADELRKKYGKDYLRKAADGDIIAAADRIAEHIVYTIHTPVKAGHDRFAKSVYNEIGGHSFKKRILGLLAGDDELPDFYNFTAMAMRINRATNSVSRLHKLVTQKQFPQYADKITAITNGVHHLTWISDAKAEVYDSFEELKNWRLDPSVFTNAAALLENRKFSTYLAQAWQQDTNTLIAYVNDMLIRHRNQRQQTWIDPPNFLSYLHEREAALDPKVYTIGFARRFSTYKRADLIFDDIDKLVQITADRNRPVNFIYAGKAHPADEPGKTLIKLVLDFQEELYEKSKGQIKIVFIPGYDMQIAKMMVSGVHAWLNSPKRPLEASGTSGMKSAVNAIPNISIMDGWWSEGYHDGKTGWKFGYETPVESETLSEQRSELLYAEDAESFYHIFPEILAEFYEPDLRGKYMEKCIMNLALNTPIFNTHRMVAEYALRYNLKLSPPVAKQIEIFRRLYESDQYHGS